jgi:membrane protein YqaA with SNARE-associated domain
MIEGLGLFGLFLAAFLAATLVPAQSEALLAAMVLSGTYGLAALLAVASLGNILGSCVNWWLGLQVDRLGQRRWFPVSEEKLQQMRETYARSGWPSLLLSWAPIIGDPLTLVAGVMKEPFWRFFLVVTFAKTARYIAVVALAKEFV